MIFEAPDEDTARHIVLGWPLTSATPGHLVDAIVDGKRARGCLITKSLVDCRARPRTGRPIPVAPRPPPDQLAAALARARADGELRPGAGPETAGMLVAVVQGMAVMAKGRAARPCRTSPTRRSQGSPPGQRKPERSTDSEGRSVAHKAGTLRIEKPQRVACSVPGVGPALPAATGPPRSTVRLIRTSPGATTSRPGNCFPWPDWLPSTPRRSTSSSTGSDSPVRPPTSPRTPAEHPDVLPDKPPARADRSGIGNRLTVTSRLMPGTERCGSGPGSPHSGGTLRILNDRRMWSGRPREMPSKARTEPVSRHQLLHHQRAIFEIG